MPARRRARFLPVVLVVCLVGLFGSTIWFLWRKSQPKPVAVETEKPFVTDIVKKSVAAGTIQPRREVEVKPRVAGIMRSVDVKPGQSVKRGDLLGEVQIIPDVVSLNEAELRLSSARVHVERAKRELDRSEGLGARGVTPQQELDRIRADHNLAQEDLRAAESRVRLVREGALAKTKGASTRVESTLEGTVLAVPIKPGSFVINSNSFNPGTTIAIVADMGDLVFKGRVDESEVGKLKEAMPVEIIVGALQDQTFRGALEHIAPKSVAKEGTTEFEIEVAFRPPPGVLVRAGYSANANIVLDRRTKVLAIHESMLIFEKDKSFVEIEAGPGRYERREVKLGLSDGIQVEVLSGVRAQEVVRKPVKGT